ncbi:MAG: hypothetical protein JWN98_2355 [Abditibacteriota bacterium]|nr:hypothetical protein [Abditibacteriota bacterium]
MIRSKYFGLLACGLAAPTISHAQTQPLKPGTVGPDVPAFQVRSGYRVTNATDKLTEARFIEVDDKGTLYVAQPRAGKILSLRDKNRDGLYETQATFTQGKEGSHGMHFYNGWLWFTQSGAVHRARDTNNDGVADETVTVIPDGQLPKGGHWWRSILVTPTGFYTSIGDSGNASDETNTDRQKIWFYDLNGQNKKLFASGVRNTEKLRFRPGTTELYGADHGSDNFGQSYGETKGNQPITDQMPPCEFNHYTEGGFYGHPFIVGYGIPRPEFKDRPDILELATKTIPPAWNLGAHWAPNGWTFLSKNTLGAQGDALVANHGSWNATKRAGYRIERVMFDPVTGKPSGAQMMVSTLNAENNNIGRPVDCVEAANGTVLWSDDQNNRVYRLSRTR